MDKLDIKWLLLVWIRIKDSSLFFDEYYKSQYTNNHNESDNSLKTYGLDLGNVSSKNIREACSLTRKWN